MSAHNTNRLVRALHASSYLPPRFSHPAGKLSGWLAYHIENKRRRIGAVNLALCFPQMPPEERRQLLAANCIETAKTFLETPYFWQRATANELRSVVNSDLAAATIEQALQQGKGLIVAAPHLGAWEILGLWLSLEYGITSLYRPQNGVLESAIRQARQRFGARLVPTRASGVKALLQALQHNQMIGILPDQDPPHSSGVQAPFFGAMANTATLLPKLAQRSRTPVLVLWLERLSQRSNQRLNHGYQLHCEPVADSIYNADLTTASTAMNQAIETGILQRPEQYWWTYQRFRRLPAGNRHY